LRRTWQTSVGYADTIAHGRAGAAEGRSPRAAISHGREGVAEGRSLRATSFQKEAVESDSMVESRIFFLFVLCFQGSISYFRVGSLSIRIK
jgi:hypothetical protein